ncbi:RagB/SusD family nutrient uptake outer membrane protein [Desertivirga brevis]|uniref:RagB/SusD family nutrient uptake outer membrane protein n=1 Tax=Desertivirga brevis TaxID=2810310 RepID=UPI001F6108C4|nr:RagB/SusD family nutrient uptake outer membrane protein [Pedobacter sp. SYSU D00873]
MKLNIKKLIVLFFAGSILAGCEGKLDLAPISNSNAENFYKTTQDFDLAANAAFATLYTFYSPTSSVSYFAEQMSDNATMYNVAGIQADRKAFKDFDLKPSNTEVYRFWQENYKALYNVNIVLEKIETANLSDQYKESVKAQMMFLRGLYYFNMVQMWGDIPLVTTPLTAAQSYNVLRSPASDVYNLVISDLKYAVDHLPLPAAVASTPGKPTKYAAETLLGKVYLTLGRKPEAAQVLMDVYGKYSLVPNYANLWGATIKNTPESIFEIQYKGGAGNPYSNYWTEFAPTENFVLTLFGGGMNQVTDDLYNEFEASDVRRDVTIAPGYTNKTGTFIPIKFPNKWVDKTAPAPNGRELSNNNFMVLRYADVLLMLSEATGDPKYLNEVRARVGLPLYGTAQYPANLYPSLDRAIEHERRVELALEFHRFFDLKRTGRAVEVVKKTKPIKNEGQLVLPIPLNVIQQNPSISQNSAYLNM